MRNDGANPGASERMEFIPDSFLANDPDCPVFGFNLACAYPFSPGASAAYRTMASLLSKAEGGLYVYPEWETHTTIVTFVNFSKRPRPTCAQRAEAQSLIPRVIQLLEKIPMPRAFQLVLQPPRLTPKAIILPIDDPCEAIPQLRRQIRAEVEKDSALLRALDDAGWNIPAIIHSTIGRFATAPPDGDGFARRFEKIKVQAAPIFLEVEELLITTETKPYMRAGEIVHRFALAKNL